MIAFLNFFRKIFQFLSKIADLMVSYIQSIFRFGSNNQQTVFSSQSPTSSFKSKNFRIFYPFSDFRLSNRFLIQSSILTLHRKFIPLNLILEKFVHKSDYELKMKNSLLKRESNGDEKVFLKQKENSFSPHFHKVYENRSIFTSVNTVLKQAERNNVHVDSLAFGGRKSISKYLTSDSKLNFNFQALEDFRNYLSLADLSFLSEKKVDKKRRLMKSRDRNLKRFKRIRNVQSPKKYNDKFDSMQMIGKDSKGYTSSRVSKDSVFRTRDLLNQINFLLKHKDSIISGDIPVGILDLSKEISDVLFSFKIPQGAYGSDASLYSADMYSTTSLNVVRRISLFSDSKIDNISSFKREIGFFNFGTTEHEEFESSSDISLGGFFSGQSYSINPFLVLGLIIYSCFELFLIFYFVSNLLGTPYQTISFFFKYSSVYFYENLSGFPSANYFFFALSFWFMVFVMFSNFLLELLDEERFNPPKISWLFFFFKEFAFDFIFFGCIIFCIVETVVFLDLIVTRFFFVGTPGFPQLLVSFFLLLYEIFFILGTTNYFTLYLEFFVFLDIKFPVFYYSDFVPLLKRFPLVQPLHLTNPLDGRPNFFLWIFDSFLQKIFSENSKSFFFSEQNRIIFQRELVQDIRKYNYLRKNLTDLKLVGQLFLRGFNGFNYRLDLKYVNVPILPEEQVIRFDWRFKNSHFDGLNSRLFRPDFFQASSARSFPLFKRLTFFKHRLKSSGSRYGYLEYLTASPESKLWSGNDPVSEAPDDYLNRLLIRSSIFSRVPNSQRQYYRFRFNKQTTVRPDTDDGRFNFLFAPSEFKFYNMKELNNLIPSKTRRNFNNSRLLLNDWSYVAGNTKPRLPFRYRTFIPLSLFTKVSFQDYLTVRSQINENYFRFTSFLSNDKSVHSPLNRKNFRFLFLKDPHVLFKNRFWNFRTSELNSSVKKNFPTVKTKNSNLSSDLLPKMQKTNKKQANSLTSFASSPTQLKKKQILSSALVNREKVSSSKEQLVKKKGMNRFVKKFVKVKKLPPLQGARVRVPFKELPGFSYNSNVKKYHSIAWFFINQKPSYYLRPVSVFTTFSQLNSSFTRTVTNYQFLSYKFNSSSERGLSYFLNLFFFGFNKMPKYDLQLFSFDYYYAQNHNFFRSVLDFYLKSNQFITIPTSKGRFASSINGGINHSLDFMFPMISELRLKEKLIPINFSYDISKVFNWSLLDFDPYYNIRNASYAKGSCYFLDARIQNWFFYQNVLWNEYYHFFFNRSFKTEGNGSRFSLGSFNPINGPLSYKLYINSPTLEVSRIGQYFYNYIPWLQYKFKWLLYPTSTYKRFDSFRHIQQHSNKKFYFSSLLRFYQVNLFRWQQASSLFIHNQSQSRNFFIHLFFHKYKILSDLKRFRDFCIFTFQQFRFDSSSKSILFPKVDFFNLLFLKNSSITPNDSLFKNKYYELFLPTFTFGDFKFFQNVVDFRRWKSLQTNYLRDWKFDNYIKYLGPLLYKYDTASLMGFFAPFEYRNQIFVTKMRNDALRFSIFFPKKVIVEENSFLDNPRFSKSILQKERRRSSIFPSLYAMHLNKPFLKQMSNYSYFLDTKVAKRNKMFLKGLYSHLQRLNSKLSLNQFSVSVDSMLSTIDRTFNDILYGFFFFNDINSKKQRMYFDKMYWLSKTQEIKQIGSMSKEVLFGKKNALKTSVSSFSLAKLTPQFGKSLDVVIPVLPPKFEFFHNKAILVDSKNFKNSSSNKSSFNSTNSTYSANDNPEIMSFLNPNVYLSFGGPKGLSSKWHRGQSWMKFVIASQNTSTLPLSPRFQYESDESREKFTNRLPGGNSFSTPRHRKFSNEMEDSKKSFSESTFPQNSLFSFNSLNGKYQIPNFVIPERSGYSNFGLSGIGRLPRLSRSFFHALFSRNKLYDFATLKKIYLKLYLMSVPLFQDTQYKTNSSFFILWYSLICSHYFPIEDSFRYNVLFGFFSKYQYHFNFSKIVSVSNLGTLSEGLFLLDSENYLLKNQYLNLKSYEKFFFFVSMLNPELKFSSLEFSKQHSTPTFSEKISSTTFSYSPFSNYLVSSISQAFSVLFSVFDKICYFSFFDCHYLLGNLYLLAVYPFSYIVNCLQWVSLRNYFSFREKGVFYRSSNDNHLFFFNYHDSKLNISSKKTYLMENYSFFAFSSSLLQNPFSYFFDTNTFLQEMEKKIFLGSFRSRLNWFMYPVHFFLSSPYSFSSYFSNSLFFLVNFSLNSFFKYNSIISCNLFSSNAFPLFNLFGKQYFFFNDFFSIFDFVEQNNRSISKYSEALNTIYPSSYFFKKISSFYTNFFSLIDSTSIFRVKLFFRFDNLNYFNSLFLYRNSSKISSKFFNIFDTFFFSSIYLNSFSFLNNFLSFQSLSSNSFLLSHYFSNSENFFDNIFQKAKSLDGSGRYTRPRSELYTLNKVFSYREFEKYRHEHHRQRFRSVVPHWIQNSLKNRYNFTRYLSSPQRRYKLKLQRLTAIRNLISTTARSRNSPAFFNRISSLNYFTDNKILSQILKLNETLSFPPSKKVESSSTKIMDTNFQTKKFTNLSGLEKSNKLHKQVSKSFKSQFLRIKELKNLRSHIRRISVSKNLLAPRIFFIEHEKSFSFLPELSRSLFLNGAENSEREIVLNQNSEMNHFFKEIFEFQTSLKRNKIRKESSKRPIVPPRIKTSLWHQFRRHEFFSQIFSRGQDLVFWKTHLEKKFFKNFKFSDLNLDRFLKLSNQKKNKLFSKLLHKQFFSSDLVFGLPPASQTNSVITLRLLNQYFSVNKLFPQSSEHSLKKFFKSDSRSPSEKVKWNKYGYFPFKTKQQEIFVRSFFSSSENFNKSLEDSRKIQPRFYKSYLYNSSLGSANPIVGGLHFVNKYAPYKYMLFMRGHEDSGEKIALKKILRFSSRKKLSNKSQTVMNSLVSENFDYGNSRKWFLPNNVRRFLRPYNKVLMSMPYIYSKWYTQNPRLSFSINSEILDVFVNHDYAEFNTICVQSLFILKRKIMFNVINLKLGSMKSKLLYFTHFDSVSLYEHEFSKTKRNSTTFLVSFFYYLSLFLPFFNFDFNSIFSFFYHMYVYFSEQFFTNYSFYSHLLNNILIKQYKHDSSDDSFLDSFYYNYAAKRLLAQIGISSSTMQGWDNPIGIFGQYVAGLNFYTYKFPFNFSYQYPDFFSGRAFSPEFILLNNLYRKNNQYYSRDLFFGEYPVGLNYRPSYHFLTFRIPSPLSPFVEYQLPFSRVFTSNAKQRRWRLPNLSLRRVYDVYPNHLSAFFNVLQTESNTISGHDITLPLKLKFLNFNYRNSDANFRRKLERSFSHKSILSSLDNFLVDSLNLKQFNALASLNSKLNFSNLVNNRRFSLKLRQWSPVHFNFYYLFNWKSFLHKFYSSDQIGVRNYKLNSFFDMYQGFIPLTLKAKSFQHLTVSQIPRSEIDSRRRVPSTLPLKQFVTLFLKYFNYVNENFHDTGYFSKEQKILRYVNRKLHPFLFFSLPSKNSFFPLFLDLGFSPEITKNKNFSFSFFSKKRRAVSDVFSKSKFFDSPIYSKFSFINHLVKTQNDDVSLVPSTKKRVRIFHKIKKIKAWFNFFPRIFNRLTTKADTFRSFFFDKFSTKYKFKFFTFSFSSFFSYYKKRVDFYLFNQSPFRFGPLNNFDSVYNLYKRSAKSLQFGYLKEKKTRFSYNSLKPLLKKQITLSRILSISQVFSLKKQKERGLNPSSWLHFDLFSRIRPAFKPFLFKFSNLFSFSQLVPKYGYSSYNFQVKSHTEFDNFFDRHPYISFGVGSFSENSLLFSESAYKEVRKRSHLLDFSKRLNFMSGPNRSTNARFRNDPLLKYGRVFSEYEPFNKDKIFYSRQSTSGNFHLFFGSTDSFSGISDFQTNLINPKFSKWTDSDDLESRVSTGFPSTRTHYFPAGPELHGSKRIKEDSEVQSTRRGLSFYPLKKSFLQSRRNFHYRFDNFYKNSIIQSFFLTPHRKALLLNTQLLRPYTMFLKWTRMDNLVLNNFKFLRQGLDFITYPLNSSRNSSFRSYYQPNLKVFFDYNAFKQRYNLALLFRELSFDEDFQLFLFQRKRFFLKSDSNLSGYVRDDKDLVNEFLVLKDIDLYQLFYGQKTKPQKNDFFDSKLNYYLSKFFGFFYKINFLYVFIFFFNFVLSFLFSFFCIIKTLHFFDFSFFFNLLPIGFSDFLFYDSRNSFFQLFFHLAVFKEYAKFTWLFSLKFLIFNFEYYFYYFIFFWSILVSRLISLRIKRHNFVSPFLVPYSLKFSDFKLNSYSGWFETAWKEVQNESIDQLTSIMHSRDIRLRYSHPMSASDFEQLKKKYKIPSRQSIEDVKGSLIDEQRLRDKFKNESSALPFFLKLKQTYAKLGYLNFLKSTNKERQSFEFQFEEFNSFHNFSTQRFYTANLNLPKDPSDVVVPFPRVKAFSFKVFFKTFFLLLTRRIRFLDFARIFNFGSSAPAHVDAYRMEDFESDFDTLFVPKESRFSETIDFNLKGGRMMPEDENIHFYRKPSTFSDLESSKHLGTETEQFHFILEFPGRFGNSHINTFSKLHSIRNLSYNNPQFGFFSFPKNAKLPQTFDEFLIFFSLQHLVSSKQTSNPFFSAQLNRYYNLWSLFQHVTRYDYNLAYYYTLDDIRSSKNRSPLLKNLLYRTSLFDNVKFWVNKASNDAIDFNFFNPYLFFPNTHNTIVHEPTAFDKFFFSQLDPIEDDYDFDGFDPKKSSQSLYDLTNGNPFYNEVQTEKKITKFSFSLLYMFYTYLFLFIFFLLLILFFCFFFLFIIILFNYIFIIFTF